MPKPANATLKENGWENTETATLTMVCAGDAFAAAALEKAPHSIVVKDFKPSKVRSTHRPSLAAVEQNRQDQGPVNAALGLERNPSSGPVQISGGQRPILPLILSLA